MIYSPIPHSNKQELRKYFLKCTRYLRLAEYSTMQSVIIR